MTTNANVVMTNTFRMTTNTNAATANTSRITTNTGAETTRTNLMRISYQATLFSSWKLKI